MHCATSPQFGLVRTRTCYFLTLPAYPGCQSYESIPCVLSGASCEQTVGCGWRKRSVRDELSKASHLASYSTSRPARGLTRCPSSTATCQMSQRSGWWRDRALRGFAKCRDTPAGPYIY